MVALRILSFGQANQPKEAWEQRGQEQRGQAPQGLEETRGDFFLKKLRVLRHFSQNGTCPSEDVEETDS